ncbi:MAG: cation transporter [Clostridia bacterium]|nr:cation transporter [Clostridia bacterium]
MQEPHQNDEYLSSTPLTEREKVIVRTSVVGICANVVLVAFKTLVGLLSHSIALILDAVNNLTDTLSSIVTLVGAKLSGKRPDKKHPLGHGRIEYVSAMIVAAIVLYAGITSLIESVKKIVTPELPDHSVWSLVVIGASVFIKLALSLYFQKLGKRVKSSALIASGKDAFFDAVLSTSVFISAVVFMITGFSAEAFVGLVISAVIIKAGISMLIETIDDILGKRADSYLTSKIREVIMKEEQVRGVYDLFINNYGPDRNYASVHVELPDVMTVSDVDSLTRRIQNAVYVETGVILTGVGVYSYNTGKGEAAQIRNDVMNTVLSHEWALQIHGFYVDTDHKEMRFDVVMSFDVDHKDALNTLYKEFGEKYPGYSLHIVADADISD